MPLYAMENQRAIAPPGGSGFYAILNCLTIARTARNRGPMQSVPACGRVWSLSSGPFRRVRSKNCTLRVHRVLQKPRTKDGNPRPGPEWIALAPNITGSLQFPLPAKFHKTDFGRSVQSAPSKILHKGNCKRFHAPYVAEMSRLPARPGEVQQNGPPKGAARIIRRDRCAWMG